MAGSRRLVGRLHLKVMVLVGSVVGLVMAGLLTATRRAQRVALTENAVSLTLHVADATYAGLERPMRAGDGEAIAQHLSTLAQTVAGMEIHLLDSDQVVVYSSAPAAVGRPVSERISLPGLPATVAEALAPQAEEASVRLASAPPAVLRPIRNGPECFHCHGESRPVLGALVVHQTRDEVAERLSADLRRTLAGGVLVALLVVTLGLVLLGLLVVRPLSDVTAAAEAIAAGDLTRAAGASRNGLAATLDRLLGQDEIGQLTNVFDRMAANLQAILKDLQEATQRLDRQASAAQGAAAQQSATAAEQMAAASQTSAVVAQITQTSKLSTEQADAVSQVADRSQATADAGQRAVSDALSGLQQLAAQVGSIARSITELSDRTRRIAEIVASVEDLSDQSNLLALNAAIEAARAGETGQGFAVVSSEMRRLAQKSKAAAGEARGLLSQVVSGTRAAVLETEEGSRRADQAAQLALAAGQSIAAMAEAMRQSAEAARQIAVHARQQTVGVEQVVKAVGQLQAAVGDGLEGTRRVKEISAELTGVSSRLTEISRKFKA